MKMNQLMTLLLLGSATASAFSAPSTPTLDWQPQEYSFVEVMLDGSGSYKDLVKRQEQVTINIKWNAWSGDGGDNYKVFFDDMLVDQGALAAGTKSGVISFTYSKAGRHSLTVELCEGDTCARSAAKPIVIADTDGAHLAPLPMDVDPNNQPRSLPQDTVVGAYFVEWGIYGRDFDVSNIPAFNLTHILYGFIPICGPNESLREIENGNSWRALALACSDSNDYEVVIHDPWAAIQKALPGVSANDPIRGTYAQLMALKQRYPDLKILPSIGGWTLSDPFHGFTEKANRDTFVASVKAFLKTWKFYDGVDIDWEYPGGQGANPNIGNPALDGQAYIDLMRELRVMLDELERETNREYELTSAIGMGYDKIEDVDYSEAVQYMDYLFAMTYDFFGGWNNVTGHQTAIYCGAHMSQGECDGTGVDENGEPRKGPAYTSDNGVQLLLQQGVPSDKIVLGVAMYGRGWEGVTRDKVQGDNPMTAKGNGKLRGTIAEGVWEPGIQDYKGLKQFMLGPTGMGIEGYEARYDEQAKAAYIWNPNNGKLVSYDSPRSVNDKGQYARSLGLAGLFAWEIDADNGDILNAMHEALSSGIPDNRPPVVSLPDTLEVDALKQITAVLQASDPDGDALSYIWNVPAGIDVSGENSSTLIITAPAVQQATTFGLAVTVSDGVNAVSRALSLVVNPGTSNNSPPDVTPIANIQIREGEQVGISLDASDPDGDDLTIVWEVPVGLTLTGSGNAVTLGAQAVDEDTIYQVRVNVSDGEFDVFSDFNVTVLNSATNNTWQQDAVYVAGDTVEYEGKAYRAKWWTKGDKPNLGGPWERLTPDTGEPEQWLASKAYRGGDRVIYQGNRYQARWWTRGEQPDTSSVWTPL